SECDVPSPFDSQQKLGVIPHAACAACRNTGNLSKTTSAFGRTAATAFTSPTLLSRAVDGLRVHRDLLSRGVQTRVHSNRRRAVKSPRSSVQTREFHEAADCRVGVERGTCPRHQLPRANALHTA